MPRTGHDHKGAAVGALIAVISIHAPLTGRDSTARWALPPYPHFNPRAPYGARLAHPQPMLVVQEISIHVPRTGHDDGGGGMGGTYAVFQSTCPVRGTTICKARCRAPAPHFNPRAPYGARRTMSPSSPAISSFQSTCPVRGTTVAFLAKIPHHLGFQSTCPVRGTTCSPVTVNLLFIHFNPRAPYGARLQNCK